MHILTYNLNGIRSAIQKGLIDWLATQSFDILCFQEVKATHDVVDLAPFEALGYRYHWHAAEKKGYSGVATFSKTAPDHVQLGCGLARYDCEGRILRTDFGDLTVLNCYFPSGTTGEVRQGVKMEFLEDFYRYVHELRQTRPHLIVVGDYNIAHTERDIHDPVRNKNTTGFLPEERAWMDRWFASGFTDAFRHAHPDTVEYSWWSYRAGARANNKGWRIDYISVADTLRDRIGGAGHFREAVHSDHGGVWLRLE
ncbi:exodeoxyribonuclease III [Rudanella lutea]|jgi:exodeoxyribonuclease-3|uniref:exodeoxyribonuclease III n=1 Tax=Rudanella lutea TaxID=451374 RepID=UPI000381A3F0|nr:exodeoxyribonuclease III [Rudanella lutea]